MTLNYVIPVSMVIEGMMLSVQSVAYAYNRNHLRAPIDEIYLGIVSLFLFLNIIWILIFIKEGRRFDGISRSLRAIQGVSIVIVGALLIYSAVINNEVNCYSAACQRFELKLAAGAIGVLDSIFYFLTPIRYSSPKSSSVIMMQNGPYVATPVPNYYYVQPPQPYLQNGQQLNIQGFTEQQQPPYLFQKRIPRITEYYVRTKPTVIHNQNFRGYRRSSLPGNIPANHNPNITYYKNNVPVTDL